jgi:hypothetical protein
MQNAMALAWLLFLIGIFAIPFLLWSFIGISAMFIRNLPVSIAVTVLIFGLIYIAGLRYLGL